MARSKYRNVPTVVDGIRFASKAEAKRYGELKLLVKSREISRLELQPRFELLVAGQSVSTYSGDFQYREAGSNRIVVEDVKGVKTDVFRIKWALVNALMPEIDWRIVRTGSACRRRVYRRGVRLADIGKSNKRLGTRKAPR